MIWWPRQGYEVIDEALAEWPEELLARARRKVALNPALIQETPRLEDPYIMCVFRLILVRLAMHVRRC